MRYWLMKSEPSVFGIDDLAKKPGMTEYWDGIRNYQARNFLRDDMRRGDLAFFYHSSCKQPGIVGVIEIFSDAYPDPSAFDPNSPYYDGASDPQNPRWLMVNVKLKQRFARVIGLDRLRANPRLAGMRVLARGNRLSVTPVTEQEWKEVMGMGDE